MWCTWGQEHHGDVNVPNVKHFQHYHASSRWTLVQQKRRVRVRDIWICDQSVFAHVLRGRPQPINGNLSRPARAATTQTSSGKNTCSSHLREEPTLKMEGEEYQKWSLLITLHIGIIFAQFGSTFRRLAMNLIPLSLTQVIAPLVTMVYQGSGVVVTTVALQHRCQT